MIVPEPKFNNSSSPVSGEKHGLSVGSLDDVWVSLDLETTGLSASQDQIIEIGAVKFNGYEILESFQTFVNPKMSLSNFTQQYTGITQNQVDDAPDISTAGPKLISFIGDSSIVGHNIAFDIGFLTEKGFALSNPISDTWDLAFVMLPNAREYSLSKLAVSMGIPHPNAHRALEDAKVTMKLFLTLVALVQELDTPIIAEMKRMGKHSSWILNYLLERVESYRLRNNTNLEGKPEKSEPPNVQILRTQIRQSKPLRPNESIRPIDVAVVESLLGDDGDLAKNIARFENRLEQKSMSVAVLNAFNDSKNLMVEAGTGVGKSFAYLIPAVVYALKNNCRVVVSTNTINLQDQLVSKDIPVLIQAMARMEDLPLEKFNYTVLKGRNNYLCLSKYSQILSSNDLSADWARLISKMLVWLRNTPAGDRHELNITNRRAAALWDQISAQSPIECNGLNGNCFIRSARDKASAAHLVIVNHSLLMADITSGKKLIPDYDLLIIDEAQHLENEATKHLGFETAQASIEDNFKAIGGDRGLLKHISLSFGRSKSAETRQQTFEKISSHIDSMLPLLHRSVTDMFTVLGKIMDDYLDAKVSIERELRITPGTRNQPLWSTLEILWENVDSKLGDMCKDLESLVTSLEGLDNAGFHDYENLFTEAFQLQQYTEQLRYKLTEFIPHPEKDKIYWINKSQKGESITLHGAPTHIGNQLEELLYSKNKSVILTSATLSTNGTFDHMQERAGFENSDTLQLGSPFDYKESALLCVPRDMPEPKSRAYQAAVEEAILEAAITARGRTMALFTSHNAIQITANTIRDDLRSEGVTVLAQGIDGPPYQLLEKFIRNPQSVLLGTSSFWEGVDIAGDALRVLIVARLPFSVPSEPIFEARSESYENPFTEYAVPQAILRLRQGFGRLIRTRTDKGVVVILDNRIISKKYGKMFLDSLPPAKLSTPTRRDMKIEIGNWLKK